jgi:serine/threonine-protein kinase
MAKVCPVCGATYADASAFCSVDGSALRADELDAGLVGTVIADRYLLTDRLGEGGMGKVYLARHVRLPQQVAIKVLRHELVSDASAVARFNREATSASRIEDERVARVYDFGETDAGVVYLAMEYVPGRTLRALVADEGALAPRRVAALVRQIAEGLDAAHRLGIVHRDLKPDNVLVVEKDGRDRVKLVDFGIAKAFGADDGGLTRTGFVVGTPQFMSPEQLLGATVDERSDVYALALVAFQCLTGELPFDATTPGRTLATRLTEAPRRLADAKGDVAWPPRVQATFDAGLAREPEQRPASAGAFAAALGDAIEAWEAPAAAPTVTAPTTPPRRRQRGVAIAAGALVLVVGGALALRDRSTSRPPAEVATATVAAPASPSATADTTRPTPPAPPVRTPTRTPTHTTVRRDSAPAAPSVPAAATTPTVDDHVVARNTLDSLVERLRDSTMRGPRVRPVAQAMAALLPRLHPPARRRAMFRLIDASVRGGNPRLACYWLRRVQPLVQGAAEQTELRRYQQRVTCGT